jgi:hypothetical protein
MAIIDKPTDHFNTVLYTGTGASLANTGVGFQPDFTWIKGRSGATEHVLTDSVRGVTIELSSNDTGADETVAQGLTAFGTDGFTVGTDGSYNTSSATYASWNWKAGGTAVSNTAGTITSSVSANTTSGFSVVTYTGVTGNYTVGHGLTGMTPKMVIVKSRDSARNWVAYHHAMGANNWIYPNLNLPKSPDVNYWNNSHPTSSVFSISNTNYPENNADGEDYVAYCFADVKGFSKFGSYVGNGSADGTFVYTGFKPAFVLIKVTSGANNWYLLDNKRNSYNVVNHELYPDLSDAEATRDIADFLSNGFKLRITSGGYNGSGSSYIYMAFAEQPFVTSTGVPTTAR